MSKDESGKRFPKRITVRSSTEEFASISDRAQRARLSTSRFLVSAAVRGTLPPLRDTLPPNPEDRAQLEFLITEIRKLGVNLNQLARASNRARLHLGMPPSASAIERAGTLAGELLRLLKKRL